MHDGSTVPPVVPDPGWFDEMDILRKLSRDKDPRVRLRACDLLLSRGDKITACPTCAAGAERETKHEQFVASASDATVEQVRALVLQIRVLMGDEPPLEPVDGREYVLRQEVARETISDEVASTSEPIDDEDLV